MLEARVAEETFQNLLVSRVALSVEQGDARAVETPPSQLGDG